MSNLLNGIAERFKAEGLVGEDWQEEMRLQGLLVELYRQYYDGEHRLTLTATQKAMMNIKDDLLDRYNDNYCEMVVDAMADRLKVDRIRAADDVAQAWIDELLEANRFDGMQIDVHTAALRDGETFVMSEYSDQLGRVKLAHELAWDGYTGVLVVYDRNGETIIAGAKVFYDGDDTRVNLYYRNRVERYVAPEDGEMQPLGEEDITRNGRLGVVPIVRFSRKKTPASELNNAIPLQDSLNRTLISMVMTGELTAFSILFSKGWEAPNGITPGMVMSAMIKDAKTGQPIIPSDKDQAQALTTMINAFDLKRIESGEVTQLIELAEWIINQIGTVTSTPVPGMMGGDSASGEALKQRDVRLVGKCQAAQVSYGNSYEDLMRMAALMQALYATTQPPALDGINTQWKTAQVRNDADILAAAVQLQKWGFDRAALRLLSQSTMANWTEDEIEQMIVEKREDSAAAMQAVPLPGFDQFNIPTGNQGVENGNGERPNPSGN